MPIRFHCQHCGQYLSAESRKAGAELKCPKCRQRLRVPETAEPKPTPPPPPDPVQPPARPASLQEFIVYDRDGQESELVFADDAPAKPAAPPAPSPDGVDRDKVAVARSVIYMQGMLLGAVALICFTLGVIVGGAVPTETAAVAEPRPCVVRGTVEFVDEDGLPAADDGAIALILPEDARPDFASKPSLESLLPGSAAPDESDAAVATVRQFGGDYARADRAGRFELRVPDAGKYFVLFVSQHRQRDEEAEVSRTHIAQVGRYFLPMDTFLDGREYRWASQRISQDETLNQRFD